MDQLLTPELLEKILARGVTERLNTRHALKQYLVDLLSEGRVFRITKTLLEGLEFGPPQINARTAPGESFVGSGEPDNPTLLHWVCQWRMLKSMGWTAGDEMVDMVIKAGADVNATMRNKTTPLFFAVKYGTLRTVDLLLEAGADIQQRDQHGRTCLYNALEHPSPPIIRRLLEHLPATETIRSTDISGRSSEITMADRVVTMLLNTNQLVSWINLGPPSSDALSESLILLHQKGVHFSEESSQALQCMGMLFRNDVVLHRQRLNAPEVFEEVAKTLVGAVIPKAFLPTNDEGTAKELSELSLDEPTDRTCPICISKVKKPTTLYCGHTFCRNCIVKHGKEEHGSHCPICRSQLCKDLHYRSHLDLTGPHILGVSHSTACCGPAHMTDEQIVAEARFQGFSQSSSIETLRAKLSEDMVRGHEDAQKGHAVKLVVEGQPDKEVFNKMSVDLSAGVSIAQGSSCTYACPESGPVCIEVSVRGMPLIARVSNRSFYTIISETVVDRLGLRRIESLQTKKLVNVLSATKLRKTKFTCLEPFTFKVGEVEVTLCNALVASPDPCGIMFGIQLGNDFLSSAVWCPIDVVVDSESASPGSIQSSQDAICMRVDGELAWMAGRSKEMLRYYSHDGKVAHLPLLRFSPFERFVNLGISLRSTVKFEQCFWCCRVFPEGMLVCSSCYEAGKTVTYCDGRCQRASWKIHREMHEARQEE